jgi:hypothetical protein
MIYLSTNTANQTCIFTLKESHEFYQLAFDYYLIVLEGANSKQQLAQVLDVITDNERYTKVHIDTNGLTVAGQYYYTIYGQTSPDNTDPNDSSIVGKLEVGTIVLVNDTDYFDEVTTTIPNTIIYEP